MADDAILTKIFEKLETIQEQVAQTAVDVNEIKSDVAVLKSDVAVLKTDVAVLKTDVAALKVGQDRIERRLGSHETRIETLEERQKA